MDISSFEKVEVNDEEGKKVNFVRVTCGLETTSGISDKGELYIWGRIHPTPNPIPTL